MNTIIRIFLAISLASALLLGAAACNSNKPSTVEYGSSVRMALNNQILNPEPASDAPVTGLDGAYASKVGKDYQSGEGEKKKGGILESMLDAMGGGEGK